MPYLQPTVRQLQPLGRPREPTPVVDAHARATDTVSSSATTTAPRGLRWRRRLAARASSS